MNPKSIRGLGEPELVGKKSLFQPPMQDSFQTLREPENIEEPKQKQVSIPKEVAAPNERIRMALDVTRKSLSIIQEYQGRHRLKTGHMLPKWRIISDALELYAQSKAGEGSENSK